MECIKYVNNINIVWIISLIVAIVAALTVIEKFYFADTFERLTENIGNDTLLDEFLVECNIDCENCKYKND